MTMHIQIDHLAGHPELAETLAEWFYNEWGRSNPDSTPEKTRAWVRDHAQRDALPLAVVALVSGVPVGAACIRATDLASRPDLGPWLGSVYVVPDHRRRGIGRQLVARAEAEAWRLGIEKLFLFTYDQEELYASLGWSFVAHCENRGRSAVIMEKAA
jgi:GNAT superfamily N-acetyltransferase